MNACEMKDIGLIEQVGFDESWNNNGPLQCRPQTLGNDRCEMFHVPVLYLGMKGKCVIMFHFELLTLCIDDSFKTTNLTKFWEIVVAIFFDPLEGLDMPTIFV